MTFRKKIYIIFIILAILELLKRTSFSVSLTTYISTICLYYLLFILFSYIKSNIDYIKYNYNGIAWIIIFSVFNIIMIIRSLMNSDSYWTYKEILVNTGPTLFIYLFIFLTKEINLFKNILRFILRYYLIASSLFIYNSTIANTGRIMCNTIPLIYYFSKKYKWIIIIFVIYSLTISFEARAWVLRAVFGLCIGLYYLFSRKYHQKFIHIYKPIFFLLLFLSLTFSYLGYKGVFNVFNMKDYLESYNIRKENTVDTRSFLYVLVQNKLEKDDSVINGVGIGVSYWDEFQADTGIYEIDTMGRTSTESGLLNMYLWGGLLGAFLFSMLFWTSAYYGIFKSRNNICKLIGLYIMFRWVISFVDEPNTWVCSNIMMYLFMGFCLNKRIRNMNDFNLKEYFKI